MYYKILDNATISRSSSLHMSKCSGCYRGSNRNGHCIIALKKKFSLIIKSKVSDIVKDNKKIKVIDQMTVDLIHEIKNLIKEDNIPMNNISIDAETGTTRERSHLIENIIGYTRSGSPSVTQLLDIYEGNKQSNRLEYIFYTD